MLALLRLGRFSVVVLSVAAVLSIAAAASRVQQATAGTSLLGRLATVEPALRRVTVLPKGEVNLMELFVAPDAELLDGERKVSLPELVTQVGRRVAVSYDVENGRRVIRSLTVESGQ